MEPEKFEGSENGEFFLIVRGFAPPYTTHYLSYSIEKIEKLKKIHFKESVEGYQRNFHHKFKLRLPEHLKEHFKFNDYLNN